MRKKRQNEDKQQKREATASMEVLAVREQRAEQVQHSYRNDQNRCSLMRSLQLFCLVIYGSDLTQEDVISVLFT